MAEQLIDLKVIDPNPYQKRIAANREKVIGIAFSIATDKMLQTPTGRWVGKRFQSAIGHTRTESYRLNAQIQAGLANGKNYPKDVTPEHIEAVKVAVAAGRDFAVMPWVVDELSDEQMYRYATIENNQREDLSPIEKMEEMKGWVAFGYNSQQIAALYPGMSDATVRGLLYFDQLPKEAKAALHEGTISQGTARALLSMQRVAPKEKVTAVIKKIEKDAGANTPEEVIEEALDHLSTAEDMWNEKRRDGKPRSAWNNGWLLDMKNFPNKLLPSLTAEDVAVALDLRDNEKAKKLVEEYIEYLDAQSAEDASEPDNAALNEEVKAAAQATLDKLTKLNQDLAGKLQHLVNPPACTACPFYTKVRGSHYCGMKPCHARKTVAWHRNLIEQASKNLGIAIYDKGDGGYRVLDGYDHRALFNSKHKGLRLIPRKMYNSYTYQHFDGIESDVALVVATGDAVEKMNGKGKSAGGSKMTEKEKAERRMMKIYRMRRLEVMWEYTAVAQGMFESVPEPVLKKLRTWENILIDDRIPEDKKRASESKGAEYQRRALVWQLIMGMSSHYSRESLTKQLTKFQELAQVKAPKALINRVTEWDAEIEAAGKAVSTATPKKGKKA
ncbi:MAG: ParB/RepB/Spo0J family partition protein [Chloroflexi bacterium]|nr:MAG: ParB/RepB/Spo0J family partition protein [Chloroflexota bacterium]